MSKKFDIFISHAAQDTGVARELADALERQGASVWIDAQQLAPGVEWDAAIEQALDDSKLAVVLITPESVMSPAQNYEMGIAIAKAAESRLRVVPVLTADAGPEAVPRAMRRLDSYHIGASHDGVTSLARQLVSSAGSGA